MAGIRLYVPERDLAPVFALWESSIDTRWPLSIERFAVIVHDPAAAGHWVAIEGDRIVGFAATHMEWESTSAAALSLLLVAPDLQRRGIGTALHDAALDHLRRSGVTHVRLGAGDVHFWEGVPDDCPDARAFFQARGWRFTEDVHDLIRDIQGYHASTEHGITIRDTVRFHVAATETDIDDLFAFVAQEFPNWLAEYEIIRASGHWSDLLIGRNPAGTIVASLIMFSPASDQTRGDKTWSLLLGEMMGALGAVGVAKAERGKGFGLALVARGAEIVRERGGRICHIHWTAVPGFYERLGFRIWHSFAMSSRDL
jgi:beta-N-acetylhexosaminidase